MDFKEAKKITVSLIKYLPKEQAITLCDTLDRYFKTKKQIPLEEQKGIELPLKEGYVLRVENDEVLPEFQQALRVYKEEEKEPVLVLTALPNAIFKEFVFDFQQFVSKRTQEELNTLSHTTSDLSFYTLTSQLNLLMNQNNSSFNRAGALLQHQFPKKDTLS